MNTQDAMNNLADVLEATLFKGREDSIPASRAVAQAVAELIAMMIEDRTGAV